MMCSIIMCSYWHMDLCWNDSLPAHNWHTLTVFWWHFGTLDAFRVLSGIIKTIYCLKVCFLKQQMHECDDNYIFRCWSWEEKRAQLSHTQLSPVIKSVAHRKNSRKADHCPGGFPLAQGSMLGNYSLQPPYVFIAAVSLLIAMLLWEWCDLQVFRYSANVFQGAGTPKDIMWII